MYRITPFVSLTDTMHFVVSNLIHSGGWTLVDDLINAIPAVGSWPVPTDPTPALQNGDYVILAAPDAGLSSCGDRFQIRIPNVAGTDIDVTVGRLDGGASVAWNPALPGWDPASTQLTTLPITFTGLGTPKVYLFSSQSTFVIAEVDVAGNTITAGSGYAFGYLSTAVLRDGNTSPVLGQGEDPYPVVAFDISNARAGGPPTFFTTFGQGECFDATDTTQLTGAVVQFLSQTGVAQELHDQPVQYGAGLPVHLLTKTLLKMDDGAGTFFLRGTFPSVFITSRDVAESVVRVDRLDAEFLIPAAYVALGPL